MQSRRAQVFDSVTGFLFFVNTYLPHHFRHAETPDVLKTMSHDEFEDWRDSGEDYRRELTHVGMRDLSCPENWGMNGEYRSDFGGFFPVQVRFTLLARQLPGHEQGGGGFHGLRVQQ